jgi:hypothetical protein
MPSPPKPPPPVDAGNIISQGEAATKNIGEAQQGINQTDFSGPYQSNTWSSSIDPTTGLPRYSDVQSYSPEQALLAQLYQGTGLIGGGTGASLAASMAPTYGQMPDFLQGSNSLINRYTQGIEPDLSYFGLRQLDQQRTQLLNSGIDPSSSAGQYAMNQTTDQLNRTIGAQIAQYAPTAMGMATSAYTTPVNTLQDFWKMGQPVGINAPFNPQASLTTPDANAAYQTQQTSLWNQYNAQVQAQNNLWGGGINLFGSAMKGMPGLMSSPYG